MDQIPFQYGFTLFARESASNFTTHDLHRHSIIAIAGMEMRGRMIIIQHENNDPKKATDFRHCHTRNKIQELKTKLRLAYIP